MTSSLLRQARVAAEPRVLSLAPFITSAVARTAPLEHEQAEAPARVAAPAPDLEVMTYESYKQRFEADLAAAHEQARAEGRVQGQAEGREAAEAEYQGCLTALRAAMASAQASQQQSIEELAESAVEIVYGAVTKILGESSSDRRQATAAVREVVKRCQDRSRLVIRVGAAQAKALQAERAALLEGLNAGQVEIVADELVDLGGCLLDSPAGSLDGRLETQLQRLREVLLQARAKWSEEHE
jgi:flagellar assembly protein FliH